MIEPPRDFKSNLKFSLLVTKISNSREKKTKMDYDFESFDDITGHIPFGNPDDLDLDFDPEFGNIPSDDPFYDRQPPEIIPEYEFRDDEDDEDDPFGDRQPPEIIPEYEFRDDDPPPPPPPNPNPNPTVDFYLDDIGLNIDDLDFMTVDPTTSPDMRESEKITLDINTEIPVQNVFQFNTQLPPSPTVHVESNKRKRKRATGNTKSGSTRKNNYPKKRRKMIKTSEQPVPTLDAAYKVLFDEKEKMKKQKISKLAIERGLHVKNGPTPWETMGAVIYSAIKHEDPRFFKEPSKPGKRARGMFGLAIGIKEGWYTEEQ